MPQYRKLHIKTTESLDINEMSSDFVRLTWVLLPLKCCKEGRGMFYPTWIRSQLFPLRTDVTDEMVEGAMREFINLNMVLVYEVNGRRYFQIRKWHEYQNTQRDAPSPYPAPPENGQELPGTEGARNELMSNSRVTHEQVTSNGREGFPIGARDRSIYISKSSSLSSSSSKGGVGGNLMYDGHAENEAVQDYTDAVTAICNVVKGENAVAPSDELQIMAYTILELDAMDRVPGFTEWWKRNGFYNGRPALKSFIKEWDNYLDGVTLTSKNGNGRNEKSKMQKGIDAIDQAFEEMEAQGLV